MWPLVTWPLLGLYRGYLVDIEIMAKKMEITI